MRPLVLPLTVCDVVIQAVSMCKFVVRQGKFAQMECWLDNVDEQKSKHVPQKNQKSDV